MATGGRLGPINGFIFQNARDTGTYVYPVVINGNGDAVWRGDDAGVGVAVGMVHLVLSESRLDH